MDEWEVLVKTKIKIWGSAKVVNYLKQLSWISDFAEGIWRQLLS